MSCVLACASNGKPSSNATFQCGGASCSTDSEYCYDMVSGVAGVSPTGGCDALPLECDGAPSCDCVMGHVAFTCGVTPMCSAVSGAITVVCPSP